MNWAEFENDVVDAAERAFSEVQSSHENEIFYAFSLYLDSDAMSVADSSNSLQALDRKLHHEDYQDATDEDVAYLKWASSEWEYEAFGGKYFRAVCQSLRQSSERNNFTSFRDNVQSALANALLKLKISGAFKAHESIGDPVLFVTVVDDDSAEKLENETAVRLNEGALLADFISRYE